MRKIVAAAVAVLLVAGCGGGGDDQAKDDAQRVCRSQHGAEVCLVKTTGPWTLEAKGFKAGSMLKQAPSGSDVAPIEARVSDDGTYPPSNQTGGLVVPSGMKASLVVTGTARDGSSVRLTIPAGSS